MLLAFISVSCDKTCSAIFQSLLSCHICFFFSDLFQLSMKESLIPLKINTIYFSTTISLSRWWTAMGLIDLPVSSRLMMHMQVYHPNIDLEGNVCLNILREDWNPVLSVNSILYGLQYLFLVILPCPCLPPTAQTLFFGWVYCLQAAWVCHFSIGFWCTVCVGLPASMWNKWWLLLL